MAQSQSLLQLGFGRTARRDRWWLQPVAVFLGLSAFVVYSTWAAFQGTRYTSGPYLSPFYSPELFCDSPHAWFGPKPAVWPAWLPFSPALLVLWAPGGFRLTCYSYRGAYYKAFWPDPPACAVGEPRKSYRGEASFPLIMQNCHLPRAHQGAYHDFRHAMECFEEAATLSPPGEDAAILRWNTCARILNADPSLRPAGTADEPTMLE